MILLFRRSHYGTTWRTASHNRIAAGRRLLDEESRVFLFSSWSSNRSFLDGPVYLHSYSRLRTIWKRQEPFSSVHRASEICTFGGTASAVAFAAQIFFVSGPCQRIYLHWFTSMPFLAPELLIWTFPPVPSFVCLFVKSSRNTVIYILGRYQPYLRIFAAVLTLLRWFARVHLL